MTVVDKQTNDLDSKLMLFWPFLCSLFQSFALILKYIYWLKDISTPDYSTPSFNPRPFNPGFFNHELFNPKGKRNF
jgi:hypothetical protein